MRHKVLPDTQRIMILVEEFKDKLKEEDVNIDQWTMWHLQLKMAIEMVQSLLAASQVHFYLCGKETMIAVEPDGMEEAFLPMGLVGHCATTGQLLNIENAYQHPLFNNQVDIETSLPIIVFPVKSEAGEVLGVLEFVNPKGIQGRSDSHKAKIDPLDFELLGYYAKLLAVALGKVFTPP